MSNEGKPLWMVFKEQKEKEALAAATAAPEARPEPLPIVKKEPPPKPKKARAAAQEPAVKSGKRAPKERKVKPDWTVRKGIYKSVAKLQGGVVKNVISHLRYKGKRVHTLRGPMSEEILNAEAARLINNRANLGEFKVVKLYMEMTDAERAKLANKHSPELIFGE
jgi:hypothetical protein